MGLSKFFKSITTCVYRAQTPTSFLNRKGTVFQFFHSASFYGMINTLCRLADRFALQNPLASSFEFSACLPTTVCMPSSRAEAERTQPVLKTSWEINASFGRSASL
ncbi:hypothetical protein TNCT_583741 [Trichonephila clavata]|uniref:Uncharacterized protein n=1 Tax=Trichonephila clavata TaxID=2740835 RepID=A0A8X6HX75_TRICU|nr:hypothetical protein TNCT_583741 [Trichonephila clavata]